MGPNRRTFTAGMLYSFGTLATSEVISAQVLAPSSIKIIKDDIHPFPNLIQPSHDSFAYAKCRQIAELRNYFANIRKLSSVSNIESERLRLAAKSLSLIHISEPTRPY